jgi:sulfur relay (sulfurtransferase) DsrF/TusC family protein
MDERNQGGPLTSVLFVLNDGPHGSERSYNALRHATAVVKQYGAEVAETDKVIVYW